MKIAIQGIKGSFHHQAVMQYVNNRSFSLIECNNFGDVFKAVKDGNAEIGCVAIENSIYGSLYENYDLINQYNFSIIGETFLRVDHNLIVSPEVDSIKEIKTVFSHPVAIAQCKKFLNHFHFKIIHKEDTAKSVEEIVKNGLIDTAAIASKLAAEIYGMKILFPAIQDYSNNYTRFLFLNNDNINQDNISKNEPIKISINFRLENKPGSLLNVLGIISKYNGNMSKIESRPIGGLVWQYQFYIDVVISHQMVSKMIEELAGYTQDLKLLGLYREGKFSK